MKLIREPALLRAIEAIGPIRFSGQVWRIVVDGRDPLEPGTAGGRRNPPGVPVLYASLEKSGALSEMRYHLTRGQSVPPSRISLRLYTLNVEIDRTLELPDLTALAYLGVDVGRYGALAYARRDREYTRLQEIAEAARFLEFGGLLVPSARAKCMNAVLFAKGPAAADIEIHRDEGLVDVLMPDSCST